ncbi:MAG: alpha/beta fold hydrolase [Myxococcota bacterium]|nr:alpha/beta fold hydrolase [Myxococcota bacterium]
MDPSAFDLPGADGVDAAALCLHGLTGTPYEIRPLAEALAARGIRARGPLLPGHGSRPEELAKLHFTDWVAAVDDEYTALRARHARVFVVGLSLGGLLCLELASRREPDAIAVVGTPLRLGAAVRLLVPLAKHVMPMLEKKEGSDIRDPGARARHPGYSRMPLASVHELVRLQRFLGRSLGEVHAPALIAHGAHDRTADPADAGRIADGLGSRAARRLVLPDSGHVVPVDYDGALLAERVADFFEAHLVESDGGGFESPVRAASLEESRATPTRGSEDSSEEDTG